MFTLLIFLMFFIGSCTLVLAFIQLIQKYKAYKQHDKSVEIIKQAQVEVYKEFAEACLLDSGFDLDNVYIAPNTCGGIIFRQNSKYFKHFNAKHLNREIYQHLSNKFEFGKIYIILPEITKLMDVWTWLHEIGHYMCQHLDDTRPDFIHEYEAEKYAETFIKQCPIIDGPSYYPQYTKNIHNVYLECCINNAKDYVKTFIDKLANDDVLVLNTYMNKNIDKYVNTPIKIPMI